MRNRQSKIKKKEIENSINNLVEAATRLSIALQDSSEKDESSVDTIIADILTLADPIVTVATKVEKADSVIFQRKEETIKSPRPIPSKKYEHLAESTQSIGERKVQKVAVCI